MCNDCNESFVLEAELVRHRKFGCQTERLRERVLDEQERQQRLLQLQLGKRLREVARVKPDDEDDEAAMEEEYLRQEEENMARAVKRAGKKKTEDSDEKSSSTKLPALPQASKKK